MSDLVDLLIERLHGAYDPMRDLLTRKGVEVTWHNPGKVGDYDNPMGYTSFNKLRVSLRYNMSESKLRSTAAHECLHLERGPFPREDGKEAREERLVDLHAAKRLVDPVLYDALVSRPTHPTWREIYAVLRVDCDLFSSYAGWRKTVQSKTALRVWEESKTFEPVWPPRWLVEAPSAAPLAARFAGVEL